MRVEANSEHSIHANPPSKEGPQLSINVLTLTGHPGTGKTATIRTLSRDLQIPQSRIFQAGEEFRRLNREDTGQEVLDFAKRSVQLDRTLDNRMTEFMRTSTEVGPVIAEGRLAGLFAKRLVSGEIAGYDNSVLSITSMILEADEEIRVRRVLKRDRKTNPNLTIEEVREKITHRASMDLRQWRRAYPDLAEIDPLDPDLLDSNGKRVYDLVIPTDHLRVYQVVGTIYNYLLESGKVKQGNSLPPHGTIFNAA